jgi:cytoskeletal protein RodZ
VEEDEQRSQRDPRRWVTLLIVVVALFVFLAASPSKDETSREESMRRESARSTSPAAKKEPTKNDASSVTVRVLGDDGVPFSGSIGSLSAGSSTQEGVTPKSFDVKVKSGKNAFDSAGGTVHKKEGGNRLLKVQIVGKGGTLAEQSTTAPYGVVSVHGKPEQ